MSPREQLLERMLSAWAELMTTIEALSGRYDTDLGDDWRAQDLLAHLALWERVANWKLTDAPIPLAADLMGREPWDLNAFNEGMRERWRDKSPDEVLAELRAAHDALVATVQAAPEEECAPQGRVWTVIDEDGAGHYEQHLPALTGAAESNA